MSKVRHNYTTVKYLNNFACGLLIIQIVLFFLLTIFLRIQNPLPTDQLDHERVSCLLYVNLFSIVGFGLFLAFINNYHFSPITFVLMIIVLVWQMYILMYSFWLRVFKGFDKFNVAIDLNMQLMIRAGRCGLSAMIGVSAASGRIGPKDILKLLPLFVFGYALNETATEIKVQAYDAGGSMIVFAYGGCFAMVLSFILGKKITPTTVPQQSYRSIIFALMGTLIMWVCWPSFNYALYAQTPMQRRLIIANTIYALAGSCISSIALSSWYKQGISIMILHKATIAGGVAIGASAQIIYIPAVALGIGIIAGVTAFFSLRHLQGRFQMAWGLLDTTGTLSAFVFPSMLGSIASCLILSAYHHQGIDQKIVSLCNPLGILARTDFTFNHKGGLQVGGLSLAIGVSMFAAGISGFLVAIDYNDEPDGFYMDDSFVDVQLVEGEEQKTEYKVQAGTRINGPESSARFQIQMDSEDPKPKRKRKTAFKTRYAT